jgi:hypothetical protein
VMIANCTARPPTNHPNAMETTMPIETHIDEARAEWSAILDRLQRELAEEEAHHAAGLEWFADWSAKVEARIVERVGDDEQMARVLREEYGVNLHAPIYEAEARLIAKKRQALELHLAAFIEATGTPVVN